MAADSGPPAATQLRGLKSYQTHCRAGASLLLSFAFSSRTFGSRFRSFFLPFLLDLPMGRGHHLRHALRLRQSLGSASLLSMVFLFSHLALMFLVLKFVYLAGADLGNLQVSHLLSAHFAPVLPVSIASLSVRSFAFLQRKLISPPAS